MVESENGEIWSLSLICDGQSIQCKSIGGTIKQRTTEYQMASMIYCHLFLETISCCSSDTFGRLELEFPRRAHRNQLFSINIDERRSEIYKLLNWFFCICFKTAKWCCVTNSGMNKPDFTYLRDGYPDGQGKWTRSRAMMDKMSSPQSQQEAG